MVDLENAKTRHVHSGAPQEVLDVGDMHILNVKVDQMTVFDGWKERFPIIPLLGFHRIDHSPRLQQWKWASDPFEEVPFERSGPIAHEQCADIHETVIRKTVGDAFQIVESERNRVDVTLPPSSRGVIDEALDRCLGSECASNIVVWRMIALHEKRIEGVDAEVEGGELWQLTVNLVHVSTINKHASIIHCQPQSQLL